MQRLEIPLFGTGSVASTDRCMVFLLTEYRGKDRIVVWFWVLWSAQSSIMWMFIAFWWKAYSFLVPLNNDVFRWKWVSMSGWMWSRATVAKGKSSGWMMACQKKKNIDLFLSLLAWICLPLSLARKDWQQPTMII